MEAVRRYFPEFSDYQIERLRQWEVLMTDWNARINLVSRKDIDHLVAHHLLHALGVAKAIRFLPGARVADIGTGGGLPGLPLAIVFPESSFTLVDSIGKKIDAVRAMAEALQLTNVTAVQARAEAMRGRFDFVLGRAVTALPTFFEWTRQLVVPGTRHSLPNGWLYLKGSRYEAELAEAGVSAGAVFPLSDYFAGEFFQEKYVVHVAAPLPHRRKN